VRRVLPACLLIYWGAFFAYRSVAIMSQWAGVGESAAAAALPSVLALGDLAIGVCGFMGASLVLFPHDGARCLDRRLFSSIGLAAVIFMTLDLGMSSLAAAGSGLSPAIPPALIVSVVMLAGMAGGAAPAGGSRDAANDNGRVPKAIGLLARLGGVPSGREAGS